MNAEAVEFTDRLTPEQLRDIWPVLTEEERFEGFLAFERPDAEELFENLLSADQYDIPRGTFLRGAVRVNRTAPGIPPVTLFRLAFAPPRP